MATRKIMFAGASGTGKTTLAKIISEDLHIPFLNGSASVLAPKTHKMTHSEMLSGDSAELWDTEWEILNKRASILSSEDSFITDRSFIDNMAYAIFKHSPHISHHLMGKFLQSCDKLLAMHCTHLILLNFTKDMVESWAIEDNKKRILNGHFQWMISTIMNELVISKDFSFLESNQVTDDSFIGKIQVEGKTIRVLLLDNADITDRLVIIHKFLNNE